jgi:hypothetical protein
MNKWKQVAERRRRWFSLLVPLPVVPISAQAAGLRCGGRLHLALCLYLTLMFCFFRITRFRLPRDVAADLAKAVIESYVETATYRLGIH